METFDNLFEVKKILPNQIVRYKKRFWNKPQNMVYIDRWRLIPEHIFLKLIVEDTIIGTNERVDWIIPTKEFFKKPRKNAKKGGSIMC